MFVALATLIGCKVGPEYQRPAAVPVGGATPAQFDGMTNANWKTAEPQAHLARGAWWELFADAELNRLEGLAVAGNQDLAIFVARMAQAQALTTVARSDLFPHLSAGAGYARTRTSANEPERGHAAGTGYDFNNFTVPLQAGWELDLWGRVRRQVEGAKARGFAAQDELEAMRLSIQAEVAADYFTLTFLQAELKLLNQTVEAYRKSLELTRNRRQGGVASDLDVSQAETQLQSAEAQVPATELQLAKMRHALATLCGQPATGFVVTLNADDALNVPGVPMVIPSELLERRPDVAAAERRMAGANADVGIAKTAFYPRLRLQGMAGLQSVNAGTLFDWPSRYWAVGPSLDLPLFTGGRNKAQLAAARAAYDETVAQYRRSVLGAIQEVEDQLVARKLLSNQLDSERAAMLASRRTLEIANNRYRSGLVTYLEVATAQSAALDRERSVVRLQAEQINAAVALVKALGGTW